MGEPVKCALRPTPPPPAAALPGAVLTGRREGRLSSRRRRAAPRHPGILGSWYPLTTASTTPGRDGWARLVWTTTLVAGALATGLFGLVLALDPYGTRAGPGRAPTPIMEVNQRLMYPQLARSGLFDSAVFGTSTVRLLEPVRLAASFGGRFANLGMNGATPWEQLRMAELFLRHVPAPATIVMGLDRSWCDGEADREGKRLTFRSFPEWLFDEDPSNDVAGAFSLHALELAGRVALNRLGIMRERVRGDGYENFLPPDIRYDPVRARRHILDPTEHGTDLAPPVPASDGRLGFPAIRWLEGFLARLPPVTRTVLILPPVHVAAQAMPGTADEGVELACKARLAAVAGAHGATLVDYRLPSPITREDANYWDKLHYRLPVAEGLMGSLEAIILAGGGDDPAGRYRVLSAGPR